MKHFLSILPLLSIALLPANHAHADAPAVPLSRAETQQLAVLTHELQKAKAEMDKANASKSTDYTDAEIKRERAAQRKFAAETALTSFQSVTRLPVEVRPYLPAGARSLYLGLHQMDTTKEPMLLHLWTAPRGLGLGPYDFEPSPICLDVFRKQRATDEFTSTEVLKRFVGKWTYVTTVSFLAQNMLTENTMKVHFLDATSKQGPVVSFETPNRDPSGPYSFTFTLITFPNGVGEDQTHPLSYVRELYGGGRELMYYDFGVNEQGKLALLQKKSLGYGVNLSEGPGKVVGTLKWNGHEYASPIAK